MAMQGPDGTVGAPLDLEKMGIKPDATMEELKKRIAQAEAVPQVLVDLFTYHEPSEAQKVSYQRIRSAALTLAKVIDSECPAGPDRTAAVRHIREAVMTANACIATGNASYR